MRAMLLSANACSLSSLVEHISNLAMGHKLLLKVWWVLRGERLQLARMFNHALVKDRPVSSLDQSIAKLPRWKILNRIGIATCYPFFLIAVFDIA